MAKSVRGGKIGTKAPAQQPTNARAIENMNEAQLDIEIANTKAQIARANKVMGKNDITNTPDARAMREAFPLGFGGATPKQIQQRGKLNERDAHKAKAFTDAYNEREAAKSRLAKFEEAKKRISGTGKTLKEIQAERTKKAVETAPKTLAWKTTSKGGWSNGGYKPKVIKAGSFEIHGESGFYRIYKEGKLIGQTDKLSTAKALAERKNL